MSCCWQKAELELEPKSVTMPAIFCFSVLVLPSVPLQKYVDSEYCSHTSGLRCCLLNSLNLLTPSYHCLLVLTGTSNQTVPKNEYIIPTHTLFPTCSFRQHRQPANPQGHKLVLSLSFLPDPIQSGFLQIYLINIFQSIPSSLIPIANPLGPQAR